jgi:hypothetical protein
MSPSLVSYVCPPQHVDETSLLLDFLLLDVAVLLRTDCYLLSTLTYTCSAGGWFPSSHSSSVCC